MNGNKNKRNIFNVILTDVPGTREYVLLLVFTVAVFLIAVMISTFLFIKAAQIDTFDTITLGEKVKLIFLFWGVTSVGLLLFSFKVILAISYRVAGPIKRMEKLLDDILAGKDGYLTLRPGDALCGVSERINKLINLYKNKPTS